MVRGGHGRRDSDTPVAVEEDTMAERVGLTRRQWARGLGTVGAAGAAGGLTGLLAACTGTGASGEAPKPAIPKADIRMMFFHTQWKAAFDEVIGNFQSKYPSITVAFEAPTSSSYIEKVTAELVAGSGPDVLSVNWDMLRTFTQKGYLHDLTPEASKDKTFAKDL